jgi:hypothetical protein
MVMFPAIRAEKLIRWEDAVLTDQHEYGKEIGTLRMPSSGMLTLCGSYKRDTA